MIKTSKQKLKLTMALLAIVIISDAYFWTIPSVHADSYYDWCVCDHYDNEAYLGTAYDMWTGSSLRGYYSNPYYFNSADMQFDNGYGGDFPGDPPMALLVWMSTPGFCGRMYDYSNNYNQFGPVLVFDHYTNQWVWVSGYQHIDSYTNVNTYNSNEIDILTDEAFFINFYTTYTIYGSDCDIQMVNGQPQHNSLIGQTKSLQSTSLNQIQQSADSTSMFNVQLDYAYIGRQTRFPNLYNPFQTQTPNSTLNLVSLDPSLICFNVTKASNIPIARCDAQIEVYSIQVITNTGTSEKCIMYLGTNVNPAFTNTTKLAILRPYINELPGTQKADRMEGYFVINSTVGQSILGVRTGSLGSYQSNPSGLGLWSNGQPNAIKISVQRLGYVLLNGNSITVFSSAAQTSPSQISTGAMGISNPQIQLSNSGNGFLYNLAVPQDQLLQADLFNPPI
jgi:hypothetical protein